MTNCAFKMCTSRRISAVFALSVNRSLALYPAKGNGMHARGNTEMVSMDGHGNKEHIPACLSSLTAYPAASISCAGLRSSNPSLICFAVTPAFRSCEIGILLLIKSRIVQPTSRSPFALNEAWTRSSVLNPASISSWAVQQEARRV